MEKILEEVHNLIWGPTLNEDVFLSWTGGFCFSESCAAALVQQTGGPCSVLAPVQAFMLKHLLLSSSVHEVPVEKIENCFVLAMQDILQQANYQNVDFTMVSIKQGETTFNPGEGLYSLTQQFDIQTIKSSQLMDYLQQSVVSLKKGFGILCFLYSVLLTHSIETLKSEMSESGEPLIEPMHGHGSQALISLFLTGKAVNNVWNGDKDLEGFLLKGISEQSEIGYLSLLEHLRYLEVGTYLKSPRNPIWVVSSETHLTVLFSCDRRLVSEETPSEKACRIFQSFDPQGGSFIPCANLGDILEQLGLEADPGYVDLMKSRLDPEGLGIILLPAFLEEYFPKRTSSVPDTFEVFHWNGLVKSNRDGVVNFKRGVAVLNETDVRSTCNVDRLKMVMQTKWPQIEVDWDLSTPSID